MADSDRVDVAGGGGAGNVEAHLHQRHGGVVVLMELDRHLVLRRLAVGDVGQRDLKGGQAVHFEVHRVACIQGRRNSLI